MDEKRRSDFALARYDSDGALDADFGDAGLATTDFASFDDGITDIALAPRGDRRVRSRGGVPRRRGPGLDVALARYEPDGSLDVKFETRARFAPISAPTSTRPRGWRSRPTG